MSEKELNEPELSDDYRVYADYLYVMDGVVKHSPIEGSVARLKATMKVQKVQRCDAVGRGLFQ